MKKRKSIAVCIAVAAVSIAASVSGVKAINETEDSRKQTDMETADLTEEQEKYLHKIKETYDVSNQKEIAEELEEKKSSQHYTADNMLTQYNPFGTNTQSLYVYFHTDEAVSVTYTVHADDGSAGDFTRAVYADGTYRTEHEFQVTGLVPDTGNTITFTLTAEDGKVTEKETFYEMGSLLGAEEVWLDVDVKGDASELKDGLYVVMGNDSTALDFIYFYDNEGVLRGEVPILGYRGHRLLFDDTSMYYSISETKMARVDRLGQVMNVYDHEGYELHHDYVFDDSGNILILASDESKDSVEDIIIRLDADSGRVEEVLDLGDLFGSYKETCVPDEDGELDWMHINTIQWLGDGAVLLSSRETSSIIKVENLYDVPEVSYVIGSASFWEGTGYEDLVLEQEGEFTLHGGQHSVTYAEDDSLDDGQYYLYMYNNNIGVSETNPDFDWSSEDLTEDSAKEGEASYYYEYLIDEDAETFQLTDSFEVPYSGYVSSAQNLGMNTVIDSGFQGWFAEYDEDHELIAAYTMNVEKFIYRVYKYDFEGFYYKQECY